MQVGEVSETLDNMSARSTDQMPFHLEKTETRCKQKESNRLCFRNVFLGGILQTAIFSSKGFVRLMGLGHFHWIPMVAWLLTRFDITAPQGPFEIWMAVVVVFDVLSLVIDLSDVVRYVAGDRQPII